MAIDTFGLPEYRVTEWEVEKDGGDIRVACGTKRFGHIEWYYTAVMALDELKSLLLECERIADTAHPISQMLDRCRSH